MLENDRFFRHGLTIVDLYKFFVEVYIVLLPISTGLAGIVGSISFINYIAATIILLGIPQIRTIPVIALPTLFYFFYTVISTIWSTNTEINWYILTNAVNLALFFVLNTHKWSKTEIRGLCKSIGISQLIVCLVVLINLPQMGSYRLTITVFSTIGISDFACGLCLIIAYWMNLASSATERRIRVASYISIAFDFAVILLTGSRGALVMFIAMALTWVFLSDYRKRTKVMTAAVIIIAFLLFHSYFIPYLPSYITNRLTIEAVMQSHGNGRYNIWLLAWKTFQNSNLGRVLFGYGFNSFSETVAYGSHGGYQDLMAHNVVIQTMIEGGLIGLVLLFWMLIDQVKTAYKSGDDMMMFALVGLIIASMSIDMQVTRIWGFILAFNCICKTGKERNEG